MGRYQHLEIHMLICLGFKKEEKKMYRIQLFVNENSRRGKVLIDSWTCPTKEIAEKKFSKLKAQFHNAEYELIMFEI